MQRRSPGGEHRLDEVGRVHDAAGRRAGADDGVNLVDEENRPLFLVELGQDRLQPLLEVSPVLGAGEQGAQIERVDVGLRQHLRHVAVDDHLREPFRDRGLADSRLADEQRVVLAPPAQDLDRALDLVAASDEGIDLAEARLLVEVGGVRLQRALSTRLGRLLVLVGGAEGLAFLVVVDLGDSVRDVVHDIEPRHVLPVEEVHRLGLALAEDRDQHVGPGHLLLAGGLHVEHRALEHALESERGLGLALVARGEHRRVLLQIAHERAPQLLDLDSAGAQHLARGGVVEQGEQQVLDGHELVPLLAGIAEGAVEGELQLLAQHDVNPPQRITHAPSYTEVDDCSRGSSRSPARPSSPRSRASSIRTPPFREYARAA